MLASPELLRLLEVPLWFLAVPVGLGALYLLMLTLASGRREPPPVPMRRPRFDVVVPAHDEERGIARTVTNLLGLDWPRGRFRVLVVADNCHDSTAQRARDAGATVLERFDTERRGKGYALELAFNRSLEEGWADAVVVVDADSEASPNLLSAFASRLEVGAWAAQADYGVLNPRASWRTRLLVIALGAFHQVRSAGRERLGLSCGLRGNGMCFSHAAIRQVPHRAFSLVEDVEYGIRLGEAGHRVHYAGEAHVLGEMVSGERASRSQRRRWEEGRREMARRFGLPLLMRALRQRSALLADLAADVLLPPLSQLAAATVTGTGLAVALTLWVGQPVAVLWAFVGALACLACYVLRGWAMSGAGARGLLDLAFAPVYVVWKLALRLRREGSPRGVWVRTAREGPQREPSMERRDVR
ncbi:MAG: glycosyltransferase family 2 protein [Myxococcaceae bacterium]|nr:glycosyltransferase family 2 protein [Myxococcaceae bacterium]